MELAKTKLRRFCYLGSLEPVYVHLRGPVKVEQYWPIISKLCQALDDFNFLGIVRQIVCQTKLVRRDEVLFVYAVYLSTDLDIGWKTNVRTAFPHCVRNDDIFLFCKYAASIRKMQKRKGFSRTVRKAITAWYTLQPPELIQIMWMEHRGCHGFTHKALMKMCHINDDIIGAASVARPFFRTCTELLKFSKENGECLELNNKNQGEIVATCKGAKRKVNSNEKESVSDCTNAEGCSSNSLPEVNGVLNTESESVEPRKVISTDKLVSRAEERMDCLQENTTENTKTTSKQEADSLPATLSTTISSKSAAQHDLKTVKSSDLKRSISLTAPVIAMSELRTTKHKSEALKIIQRYKLHYSQVPGHFLCYAPIMEALIPTMSYLQLFKCWRNMARFNLLSLDLVNLKVINLYKTMLEDKSLLYKDNIHPVVLLVKLDKLGIREDTTKSLAKKATALRTNYLRNLYVQSFGHNRGTGLRIHITINLQANYKKKLLRNYKKLSYLDAAVALAFGYYKKESNVDVFRWGDHKTKLDSIPWTKDMTIEEAKDVCMKIENARNNQRLALPVLNVLTQNKIYDLFIVIVPTAGRGNPKQQSDFLCKFMDRYRESKNPKAKYVIVNLRKFKRSMTYSMERNENILEICGLDEHTVDLINDFALNHFG